MEYNNKHVVYNQDEFLKYREKLINKIFAILGIYEDCEKVKNFNSYIQYVERTKIELIGFYNEYNNICMISIINMLTGLQELDVLNHKKVKSSVFHLISVIQKMEV